MTQVSIILREEDRNFIANAVKSGRYVTEREVVTEAIAEMKLREQARQTWVAELRTKVAVGIAQADRGEFVEFTAADIMKEGRIRVGGIPAAN